MNKNDKKQPQYEERSAVVAADPRIALLSEFSNLKTFFHLGNDDCDYDHYD